MTSALNCILDDPPAILTFPGRCPRDLSDFNKTESSISPLQSWPPLPVSYILVNSITIHSRTPSQKFESYFFHFLLFILVDQHALLPLPLKHPKSVLFCSLPILSAKLELPSSPAWATQWSSNSNLTGLLLSLEHTKQFVSSMRPLQ